MSLPSSLQSLAPVLRGAVDYAGLFPPADLAMDAAVGNFGEYRASAESWALGRFIAPAARLEQLTEALDRSADHAWTGARVSATLGADLAADFDRIDGFNRRWQPASILVDAVEVRLGDPAAIAALGPRLPAGLRCYVEVPLDQGRTAALDALVSAGLPAKIRMGGVTPDLFPRPELVAAFLAEVAARQLAFKATAGLHHPLRGEYRLTYAEGSPRSPMYGFLDLILATLLALEGASPTTISAALLEGSPGAIGWDGQTLRWRDHSFDPPRIDRLRRVWHGFGSCSFREPIDELEPALTP